MQEMFSLSNRSTKKGKYSACVAVLLILGALICEIIYISLVAQDIPNPSQYSSVWDEQYLKRMLAFRNRILDSQIAAIFCLCIALGLLVHTIFTVKKVIN